MISPKNRQQQKAKWKKKDQAKSLGKRAEKKVQRCEECGKVGHIAVNCTNPGDGSERKHREMEGLPVAEALLLTDEGKAEQDENDPANLLNGPAVEAKVQEPKEKPKETDGEKILRITKTLRSKATQGFMNKNLKDVRDRRIIRTTLHQYANSEKLELLVENPTDYIEEILVASMSTATNTRLCSAHNISEKRSVFGWWALLLLVLNMHESFFLAITGVINRIERLEQTIPYTVRNLHQMFPIFKGNLFGHEIDIELRAWDLIAVGIAIRICIVAVLEELFKDFMLLTLVNVGVASAMSAFGGVTGLSYTYQTFKEIAFLLEYFRHCIAPLLFTIMEVRNGTSQLKFTTRFLGHFFCSASREIGICIHIIWNLTAFFFLQDKGKMLDWLGLLGGQEQWGSYLEDICLAAMNTKKVAVQAGFKWKQGKIQCIAKFGARMRFGIVGWFPTVFRTCHHNEVVSTEGRVGKKLPMHESKQIQESVKREWNRLVRENMDFFCLEIETVWKPMDYREWASSFPPAKRDYFLKFEDMVYTIPVGTPASAFIKRELAMREQTSWDWSTIKDPRWIQGCPPELSAKIGPWLRPLAKEVREGLRPQETGDGYYREDFIREGKQIIYTCGLSGEQQGEAYALSLATIKQMCGSDEKVIIVEDDQSRFDLHLTEGPFSFLHKFYSRKIGRKNANCLRRKLSKGRSSMGSKYSVPYTMQSGWPDTSIGDTIINAVMKYDVHGRGRKWISIICGDDSVTITTDKELERIGGIDQLVAHYAKFGMEVEGKFTDDPDIPEFCSSRFVRAGTLSNLLPNYILFPKIGKVLGRMGWDMVNRTPKQSDQWVVAIATTLRSFGKYDPVLASFATNILNRFSGTEALELRRTEWERYFDNSRTYSQQDIYYSYHVHYGMSASDVDELADYLLTCELGALEHPYLQVLAQTDC
jgi:hypothetical protein